MFFNPTFLFLRFICWVDETNPTYPLQVRSEVELIKKNWNNISVAGQEIVKGAELPSLGEVEMKYLEEKEPNKPVEVTPTAT